MDDQLGRKRADQLNEFLRDELKHFVGEINGPPLWEQLKLTGEKALMKARDIGLIDSVTKQLEPTITVAKNEPDDGTIRMNVAYKIS